MKKRLKIILLIPGILVLICGLLLLFFTVFAYNPKPEILLEPEFVPKSRPQSPGEEDATPGDLHLVTWNLGYAGLDEHTDFVMEGGTMGLPRSQAAVEEALAKMTDFLAAREADVYFLQEVDRASSRTKKLNQLQELERSLPDYYGWYGQNYKALFVPYPPASPLKAMDSGVLTLSRFDSVPAIRIQLPGRFSWPVWIFHLRRCAVITRIPSPLEGRDWYLINIHLSAYDNGTMRKEQLDFLKETIAGLYGQGHYVVVGGDWNSIFPGVNRTSFGAYVTSEENLFWLQDMPGDWSLPGWQWCFQPEIPTCRSLDQPYVPGENFVTIIDGFYVSPNVEVREIRNFDLGFEHSDHNPVEVTLRARL